MVLQYSGISPAPVLTCNERDRVDHLLRCHDCLDDGEARLSESAST